MHLVKLENYFKKNDENGRLVGNGNGNLNH